MKHKYIFRTMTALCAALLSVGGLSVPAYAQTPEGQDATNDDNVIVEQPKEDTPPLTPEGNAALVDDYGGNKQLITVTTKAGNYTGGGVPQYRSPAYRTPAGDGKSPFGASIRSTQRIG